jgi:hypothetical protein
METVNQLQEIATEIQSTLIEPLSKKTFFSLNEIVERATHRIISLPTVQRGFVWKPYQIENLWDSLLRGYPVGAFVLSKKITSGKDEYELLDGQQRASAICLGFYNPLNDKENVNHQIFKTSYDNIMVFIDLLKPDSDIDNRKYFFRVITKSHPWGYRKQENQKILESNDRNKAMSYYNIENNSYYKKSLNEFWPYDACLPIPFGLFVNAQSINELKIFVDEWSEKVKFSSEKVKKIRQGKINLYSLEEIFSEVKKMTQTQKIPLLFLDSSHLYSIENSNGSKKELITNEEKEFLDETNDEIIEEDLGKVEDRNISEVENLFIRLNSGGTPLRGEELNYSVLKAHITGDLQNKIEEKCKGLFYPARFITITFRLFNNLPGNNNDNDRDAISMKIKPKQFQRLMNAKGKEKFIQFLEEFLNKNYVEKLKEILIYNPETNSIGLPSFIACSIADKSPEIMFMFLYRLYIKKDDITIDLKPNVLGIITLFMWLGRGEKQKDHGKLLENIWHCVKKNETKVFWSSDTLQRAMLKDRDFEIMTPFPDIRTLKRIIPAQNANISAMTLDKIYDSEYGAFIYKMFYNKDLILYAQRAALSEWFSELEEFNLEDTNRPFDYDHICPNAYTHNKKNIHRALRDWYSSNGNFRAWPYSLNRGDQDDSPAKKLKETSDLLNSFCKKDWLELEEDVRKTIRENFTAKKIINHILNRNKEICFEWYDKLKINDLVPSKPKKTNIIKLFESVIKRTNWKDEKEDDDRRAYYMPIGENNLYLYFSFDTEEFNTLKENNVFFGIYEEDSNSTIDKIKSNKKLSENIFKEKHYYYSHFTLIAFNKDSINTLFSEFDLWLSKLKFPDREINEIINKKFRNSIKSECYNEIIL